MKITRVKRTQKPSHKGMSRGVLLSPSVFCIRSFQRNTPSKVLALAQHRGTTSICQMLGVFLPLHPMNNIMLL